MHGKVETFASYEELMSMTEIEKSELAEKASENSIARIGLTRKSSSLQTRIWLLVIPLPKIPPRLIATMPLRSKVSRPELRVWHDAVEECLQAHGLHHNHIMLMVFPLSVDLDMISTMKPSQQERFTHGHFRIPSSANCASGTSPEEWEAKSHQD